uniref:Ixostatin n=1 Tax=Steinernema glaseri TaxID=37863 RepID=A0A1I7Y6K0_9BILA
MTAKAVFLVCTVCLSFAWSLNICTEKEPEWELIFDGCNPTPLPCVKSAILRDDVKDGSYGRGGVRRCCGTRCRIEELRTCPEDDSLMNKSVV